MKKLMALTVLVVWVAHAEIPWPEHPRPDWERKEWVNLNGPWQFAFDKDGKGLAERWFQADASRFDKTITVPFSWGSPMSGVQDETNTGWYRRTIEIPESWRGKRVFLCVGAADYSLEAWVDGMPVGDHKGGYAPMEFELTHVAKYGQKQTVTFRAWDSPDRRGPYLYGKQEYGNVRGIWQTVYLEARGDVYFETVHFTPDIDRGTVRADVTLASPAKSTVRAYFDFKKEDHPLEVSVTIPAGEMEASCEIALNDVKLWDLDHPYLYELAVRLMAGSERLDRVQTYFGMRKISVMTMPGTDYRYVAINNKPHYMRLCLDQAFDPLAYYTYRDDAFVRNDMMISKRLGLSGNRIHIKMEVPRRLYWADRLGVLIMADVPHCWNDPAGSMQEYFEHHERTLRAMIKRDYNHPSIFSWVLFNETWGLFTKWDPQQKQAYLPETQRRVAAAWLTAKKLDRTRLVEDQSACNRDHVISDLDTWHGYMAGHGWEREVASWCRDTFAGSKNNYIAGHVQRQEPMMNSECGNVWGYYGATGCIDQSWDYHQMMNAFRRNPRCVGFLYTEHHDVSTEWNGYVRDDRTPKFSGVDELFPGMTFADLHADCYIALDPVLCKTLEAGATWTMPVDLSLATDRLDGHAVTLAHKLRYWTADGKFEESGDVGCGSFTLAAWQHGRLAQVPVALPAKTAAGVVCFTLRDGDAVVARNFACFVTKGAKPARTVSVAPGDYAKAEWSLKTWKIFDGLKVDGTGDGFFEYALDVPVEDKPAVFRAEISTKRLYAKDVRDDADKHGLQYTDKYNQFVCRSLNPNSSPMTSTDTWPGAVRVYANGELLQTVELPNDPADHRGILSWNAQKRDGHLHEAGSYGWPVEVEIPSAVRAKSKDGKLVIRLEATDGKGLAVYGSAFGRIPCDPSVAY